MTRFVFDSVSARLDRALLAAAIALLLSAVMPRDVAAQNVGGVYVDAAGMLRDSASLSRDEKLKLLRNEAGDAAATGSVAVASRLRKVSLRRLEQAVRELRDAGQPVSSDILHLAGLQEVRYVFFFPDEADVVLAGPAEGWKPLPNGDVVGERSGRPVLHLDDLIVALRYAFAVGPVDSFFGCSIEPTDEGIKRHSEFLSRLGSLDRSRSDEILRGMEQAMGPQKILIYGAPESSRFALQMIAADYRLKRLALGHDPSPSKKVPSYLDFAAKSVTPGPQPQHRWWFVGHFDAIRHAADRLAFEFEGAGLRVDTAPTLIGNGKAAAGGAAKAPKPSHAATLFAEAATRGFPELAEKIPPFAQLRNLVSLAVATELIRQNVESKPGSPSAPPTSEIPAARWRPDYFLTPACSIAEYPAPKQTPALANVRIVQDRHWLFSISGGVEVDAVALSAPERLKPAADAKLETARTVGKAPRDGDRWWWD